MRIVLTGSKGSGKSSIGRELGVRLGLRVVETDDIIEQLFAKQHGKPATCRMICREYGETYFRKLEREAVNIAVNTDDCIICTGGQTLMHPNSRQMLAKSGTVVHLKVDFDKIWERTAAGGLPPFFPEKNPQKWFRQRVEKINQVLSSVAHVTVDVTDCTPTEAAAKIKRLTSVTTS